MRGRVAGCAALLLALLTGCGDGGAKAETKPARPPATAAGVDGDVDPGKVFTDAELKAALLPAKAIGARARAYDVMSGPSNPYQGGGDWGSCEPGKEAHEQLLRLRGPSASHTVRPFPGAVEDEHPYVHESLLSMTAEQAGRRIELRRQLNKACPRVTVDTDAAPVEEHHVAERLPDLGDEALLETSRIEGGDGYDGSLPRYDVEVRVGGVLVRVSAGTDKDLTLTSAARAAARVRTELHRAG
ncbi:hypothetical protein [Streptomyces longisporoflavus]|uniref:Lipoprotein n=1 Tax=Streptomyces longisporoflavus TaxID=28044 RepID=A0ABW7QSU3_9ACTN